MADKDKSTKNKTLKSTEALDKVDGATELADILQQIDQNADLGKAIEKVFDETTDLNEIQAKIILLIKNYLETKKKSGEDISKIEELEKKITQDITKFTEKFTKVLEEDIDPNLGTVDKKDKSNLLNIEARKNLKRIMKNFAVYEVYKVMNPHRLAGETKEDNYRNNLMRGGEKLASRHEGGKESDLKQYGAAEVARIKSQAALMNKGGGIGRG